MKNSSIEAIISSIEGKSLLELKTLTNLFQERFAVTAAPPPEIPKNDSAYWTPSYSLKLISVNCTPGSKIALIKLIRELSCCGLKEAKEIIENKDQLPKTIWSKCNEHPTECRKEIQPVREKLEALGAVLDEDYNYGYYD